MKPRCIMGVVEEKLQVEIFLEVEKVSHARSLM